MYPSLYQNQCYGLAILQLQYNTIQGMGLTWELLHKNYYFVSSSLLLFLVPIGNSDEGNRNSLLLSLGVASVLAFQCSLD
jgi:hypothetical protein